ncbi:MAG: hypothetical protein H6908_01965 [Hyphomicrobiales bacterium]|nr:hypothetical protein [Hyphomicrobiales bacterium]
MPDEYEALEADTLDYQSALSVMLRTEMKRKLLHSMKEYADPLRKTPFEGGAIVIYGTTLITIARDTGIHFPIEGQKAGDIDILIEPLKHSRVLNDETTFGKQYQLTMGPFFHDVMKSLGFVLLDSDNTDLAFSKPFVVKKHFSQEEIKQIALKEKTVVAIPPEGIDVLMEVDLVSQRPISVLPPRSVENLSNGKTSILIDDWRNLLAKKIVRSMMPESVSPSGFTIRKLFQHSKDPNGFKPRDLIDIYNITNSDPKLVDLSDGPNSDISLLRVLCITYFARFGTDIEKIDLSHFSPSNANVSAYQQAMQKRLSETYSLTRNVTEKIFSVYSELVQSIFPQKSEDKNKVIVTKEEEEFVSRTQGYVRLESRIQQVSPTIETGLLKKVHSSVFSKHPYLEERIKKHPTLLENIQKLTENRVTF